MRTSLLLTLLLAAYSSFSQSPVDVSGTWYGNSNFLSINYKVTTVINQKGSQLSGYTITTTMNDKDSSKMLFTGIIKGTEVELYPKEFEYKTGKACMSNSFLTYSAKGPQFRSKTN